MHYPTSCSARRRRRAGTHAAAGACPGCGRAHESQPVLGRYQYLTNKKLILRVDLDTGAILSKEAGAESVLFGQDGRLFITPTWKRATSRIIWKSHPGSGDSGHGSADPPRRRGVRRDQRICRHGPRRQPPRAHYQDQGLPPCSCSGATRWKKSSRSLRPERRECGQCGMGARWQNAVRGLYPGIPGKDSCQYGSWRCRSIGAARAISRSFQADAATTRSSCFKCIVANGRTLAANGACLEAKDLKGEHRALYLIDLADSRPPVIQVPVPSASAGGTAGVKR